MKYCSTYLWERGEEEAYNPVSLVLQQAQVRKQSVMLACVCRGRAEGCGATVLERENSGIVEAGAIPTTDNSVLGTEISGYFTEALIEWFHRECLELVGGKWRLAEVERRLYREIEVICGEVIQYGRKKGVNTCMDCVGMLLVEHHFWMFSMGKGRVFLLNRRYNRKHMRCIMDASISGQVSEFVWESGVIQKRIGILLCLDPVLDREEIPDATEVLIGDAFTEERLQKRLKELWGGRGRSVIYFRTY